MRVLRYYAHSGYTSDADLEARGQRRITVNLGPSLGQNKSLSSPETTSADFEFLISATPFIVVVTYVAPLECVHNLSTRTRGLLFFDRDRDTKESQERAYLFIFVYSVPGCEHLLRLYCTPLTLFVRASFKSNVVPLRRQQERQQMRIHGPRSLPSVSSLLALKVRPASGQRHISNPRG